MKESRAQSKIIKQQAQILSLLTMIAGAVGLEFHDVQSALDTGEPIAPNKKPKRTALEVAADTPEPVIVPDKPDSRLMSESVQEEEGDSSGEPNALPTISNDSD